MLVSVIIPTYNSEKYIISAINSVLAQTYQNFEIIIVDDGSNDNTGSIIENIKDHRIKYLYQENSGPASARNNGLKNANGEFIAFLDADDLWKSEKLQIQIDAFNNNKNICLIYNALSVQTELSKEYEIKRFHNYDKFNLIKNLLINPLGSVPYPSTVMIKKSYIDETGYFDTDLFTGEDWDLWLRLAFKADFYYIDQILTERFKPKTSITSSINLERAEYCHVKVLNTFFNNQFMDKSYKSLKSEAFSSMYFKLASSYLYRYKDCIERKSYINFYNSFIYNPVSLFKLDRIKFLVKLLLRAIILRYNIF